MGKNVSSENFNFLLYVIFNALIGKRYYELFMSKNRYF